MNQDQKIHKILDNRNAYDKKKEVQFRDFMPKLTHTKKNFEELGIKLHYIPTGFTDICCNLIIYYYHMLLSSLKEEKFNHH